MGSSPGCSSFSFDNQQIDALRQSPLFQFDFAKPDCVSLDCRTGNEYDFVSEKTPPPCCFRSQQRNSGSVADASRHHRVRYGGKNVFFSLFRYSKNRTLVISIA